MSKTEVIKIRVTPEERKSLEADGISLSDAVRARLFYYDVPQPKKLDEDVIREGLSQKIYTKVPDGVKMSLRESKALRNERARKAKK